MKRNGNAKCAVSLLLMVALVSSSWAVEAAGQSKETSKLIVNGGLEGKYNPRGGSALPAQWRGNPWGLAKGRHIEETANPRSGRSATKIECDALPTGGISFYQEDLMIPLVPGRKYILTAWMRSDTDAGNVHMGIHDCPELSRSVNVTRGWRKYTMEKTYTGVSDSHFVIFCYYDRRPGNVVFDDITLTVEQDKAAALSMSPNLLPNAGFTVARSGFAPDWWNWYNVLGSDRYYKDWPDGWQLVADHHIPGTRSMKLSDGACLQTSYLSRHRHVKLSKGVTFTFSAYFKSAKPDTKAHMDLGGWKGINEVSEVTVGTEWKRHHVTGTAKEDNARPFMRIRLEGSGPLWVNAPQLEQGKTATEWRLSDRDKRRAPGIPDVKPEEKLAIPRIDCPVVEEAPVIDGVADDAAWEKAAVTSPFMELERTEEHSKLGGPADPPTDTYVCRDDEKLYIAFRCHEPMSELVARQTQRDEYGILADDCVEVFISRKADGSDYLHLAVNPRGAQYDAKGYDKTFNTAWDCKARREKGAWSVEFAIPFSSIEAKPGAPLRINLARYRAQRGGKEQYSCLAPVKETFHDSARFCFLGGAEEGDFAAPPEGELIAYLDRSFYTTETQANIFVDVVPAGTPVRFKLGRVERKEALPASRLIPIDLSSLAQGEHPVQVNVGKRQAQLVLKKLLPKDNAVKIDRIHRTLMVDGKPFLPIGPNGGSARAMKGLSDHGFNFAYARVHGAFDEEAQKKLRDALDTAASLGMRVTVWYWNGTFRKDYAKWQGELLRIVETFKDHPAILAWWVFDEPRVTEFKELAGLCDRVNKADPYHPAFVEWCDRGHGWTSAMGEVAGDIYAMHKYAINSHDQSPHEAYLSIGLFCDGMTASGKMTGTPVSFMNGIHGWTSAIREPSPLENRFLTYVALIHGARALMYYIWAPPANPALRDSFGPLCREMETLAPVLANPEVKEKVTCDNEQIDYTAFDTPEGFYVIALNTDENEEKATFRIKGAKGEASVLFEDRELRLADGALRDTFKPLERHVYRFESVE